MGTKIAKIVFRAYRRQKWIDLRQTETRMINGQFHTVEYIALYENASILWYLSVIIREDGMSQRPPGRAPTCFITE